MKERPILFSAPMIRALLAGSKTQTRRIVKTEHDREFLSLLKRPLRSENDPEVLRAWFGGRDRSASVEVTCPYGERGDRLWVRESWAAPHAFDHLPPRLIPAGTRFHYAASEDLGGLLGRPSIHMPRFASRILLEVTGVRVERLQAISNDDAYAEGAADWAAEIVRNGNKFPSAQRAFQALWESINGPEAWAANPWVWAVSFRRLS